MLTKTKIMKKYILILTLLIFCACKETRIDNILYFAEAQPINDSQLKKIPTKFIGTYFIKDSVFLNIDKNMIAYQYDYNVKIHENQLDSLNDEIIFRENKFFLKSTNEVLKNKKLGDSISLVLKYIDTIFAFSKDQQAKRINGKLILSTKDSLYWRIKILTLDKNTIKIQELYAGKDLQILDSLTKIKAKQLKDSNFVVKPTRSEFAKILKVKNIGTSSSFVKVNR